MARKPHASKAPQTSRRWVSVKGAPRLYSRTGTKTVAFVYKYSDGRTETLATASVDDKAQVKQAEITARRQALDIQAGRIIAGSVADLIDRFLTEIAPHKYADQSKNGILSRRQKAANLIKVFGAMSPTALKTIHGYQYLDARASSGAPEAGNKEMSLMRVICTQAVKWGIIEANPFLNMERNVSDSKTRDISRSQVTRFYLWCVRQDDQQARTMGTASMFSFLTGFRSTEVRNFLRSGIVRDGVLLPNAKRKKGERQIMKLRKWSLKLRCVVARAQQREEKVQSLYLFSTVRRSQAYTRHGWGAVWRSVWARYLGIEENLVTSHPEYFNLQEIRPAAITEKLTERSADVYDFAAHANPATTHRHYDRRRVNSAKALD